VGKRPALVTTTLIERWRVAVPQIRQMQYFVAVAEDRQFSKAAQRLGVGQSTISEQIRSLEDELGAELLLRTSRSVTLTPAGTAFLSGARKILSELQHLVLTVQGHARGELGQLRIGAVGPALSRAVPTILKRMSQLSPGIELALQTMSTENQVVALTQGNLEAGFVRGVRRRPGLKVETVADEPLWAVLPSDHRLAQETAVDLVDLHGETFVFWPRAANASFYDQIISTCHQHDCIPGRIIESTDMQTQLALIGAGGGVSVQPRSFREPSREDLRFLPLKGSVRTVALQLAWSPTYETPALRALLHAARLAKPVLRDGPT
jgi:DNA-binding transcriptional LysR family regulator